MSEEQVEDPGIPLELVRVYCKSCHGWYGDAFGSCTYGCDFDGLTEAERPEGNLMISVYKLLYLNSLSDARKNAQKEDGA